MPSINRVYLLGHLGADAVKEAVSGGKVMTKWRMATGGDTPQWHSCVAWDKSAEIAGDLKKGDLVLVEGEIRYREYKEKWYTDIVARWVTPLSKREPEPVFKDAPPDESDELPF